MALGHSPQIVRDGLVLYLDAANLKSYPGTGTTWLDLTGNNNTTLINSIGFNTDNNGFLELDGTDEYAKISNNLENKINGISEATLNMWIKLNSGANGSSNSGIIQLTGHTNANGNLYFYTDSARVGGIWLNIFRTNRLFTGDWLPTFDPTNWHMLTVTTTPGSNGWKMFLNGDLKYQTTGQNTVSVNSELFDGLTIGRNSSRSIRGKISITQIYNRALSQSEIKQNFNALRGRFDI